MRGCLLYTSDYALYTEIKAANDGKSWSEWEDEYRLRDELALEKFAKENREGIDVYKRQCLHRL